MANWCGKIQPRLFTHGYGDQLRGKHNEKWRLTEGKSMFFRKILILIQN